MANELESIRLAIRVGNIDSARNELAQLVKADPDNAEAWRLLAEALDDEDQVVRCLDQAQAAEARLGERAARPKPLYDDRAVTGTVPLPARRPSSRKRAAAQRQARALRMLVISLGVLLATTACVLLGLIGTGLQTAQAAVTLAAPIVVPSLTPTSLLPTLPPVWTPAPAGDQPTPLPAWTAPPTETATPPVLPTRDPAETAASPQPTELVPTRALPTAGPTNTPTATLGASAAIQPTSLATVAAPTVIPWASPTPLGPTSLEIILPSTYDIIAGNPVAVQAVRVTRLTFRARTLLGVQLLLEPNAGERIFAAQDSGLQTEFAERLLADVARGLGGVDTIVFISTEFHADVLLSLFQRDLWFATRRDPTGGYFVSHDLVRADLIAGVPTIQVWPGATEDAWR
jgi:hypothetical protein